MHGWKSWRSGCYEFVHSFHTHNLKDDKLNSGGGVVRNDGDIILNKRLGHSLITNKFVARGFSLISLANASLDWTMTRTSSWLFTMVPRRSSSLTMGLSVPTTIIRPIDYYHHVSDVDFTSSGPLSMSLWRMSGVYRVYQQCTSCFTAYRYTGNPYFCSAFFKKALSVPGVPQVLR